MKTRTYNATSPINVPEPISAAPIEPKRRSGLREKRRRKPTDRRSSTPTITRQGPVNFETPALRG